MIPEAHPALRIALAHTLLLACAGLSFCEGACGLDKVRLAELIKGNDVAPIIALSEAELDEAGNLGIASYCFLAKRLEEEASKSGAASAAAADAARQLYLRAFKSSTGLVRREAGLALLASLDEAKLWGDLLSFSGEFEGSCGSSWDIGRMRLRAMVALGLYGDASALAARIAAAYPDRAIENTDELDYHAALAALRLTPAGGPSAAWLPAFRRLLLEAPYSDWSAQAFAILKSEPRLAASFTEEELHAVAMRDAVKIKEYGLASREARLAAGAALSAAASKAMVADAGKAFLYSASSKEGETRFAALETAAAKGGGLKDREGVAWTALFYRARFARALERWKPASELFAQAAAWAPTGADADSCRWYLADCAYAGILASTPKTASAAQKAAAAGAARASLLDALAASSASWSEPRRFADLVGRLLGEALREGDFKLVVSMADRLAAKLDPASSARVGYAAARVRELGLGTKAEAVRSADLAKAQAAFAAIARSDSSPLYYRALAAWRSGEEPELAPLDESAATEAAERTADAPPDELEAYIDGMASFGLVDAALSMARAREAMLGDAALRRLARRFSENGRPDCALRLAMDLASRDGYRPIEADYALLYPRPYLDLMRAHASEAGLSESLALGIVRSESLFNATVKSRAGAVGLSQLMPATAAAQAKAIGLKSYDLHDPKDNLDIGMAHFGYLLGRTRGRPIRAMMAYNAGWGRYLRGAKGTEGLPDDLAVETFGIDETRDYCRKILSAAVMYDALYYGNKVGATVGGIVGPK
jgi:soluble lytic murein transglycosylase